MGATGKVLLHSTLLVCGAIGLASACFHAAEYNAPRSNRWLRHRVLQAMEYLDHPPGPDGARTIAVIGSSDVEVGVDPVGLDEEFLRRGVKTRTINLGFRNTHPAGLRLLAKRLERSLERQGSRLDLVAVKLTPLHMTRRYAAQFSALDSSIRFSDATVALHTPGMIAESFVSQPLRAFEIGMSRAFFDCISPVMVAHYVGEILTQGMRRWPEVTPAQRKVYGFLFTLWYDDELNPEPAWDRVRRGDFHYGHAGNSDRLQKLFDEIKDPAAIDALVAMHEKDYGAISLEFDPAAVAELVSALKQFKRSARQVVLLYFPDSPALGRSEDALRRLDDVIDRVGREAGVTVLDLSRRGAFTDGDYFDRFHLNVGGRNKLARELANHLFDGI